MLLHSVSIIGSQMDLGAFRKGVDMGPLAIRHAGLIPEIRDTGYDVIDCGDVVPLVAEDEGNSHMRYEKEINDSNRRRYECIVSNYRDGRIPIVPGGDHSIAMGSVSASSA